jgi:hypothetical protein
MTDTNEYISSSKIQTQKGRMLVKEGQKEKNLKTTTGMFEIWNTKNKTCCRLHSHSTLWIFESRETRNGTEAKCNLEQPEEFP